MSEPVTGDGTKDDPWVLRTPPGQSQYLAYRDTTANPPTLVCIVGKTTPVTNFDAWKTCTRC